MLKQDFVEYCSNIHNSKYDYSLLPEEFKSSQSIQIIYPIHGEFWQRPAGHLNGYRCPNCSNISSSYELEIIKVFEGRYNVLKNYRPSWLIPNGYPRPCEIDIYIPDLNLGIEFNGNKFHHSSNSFTCFDNKSNTYHKEKYDLCKKNGINLIHIFEFEDFQTWLEILRQITIEYKIEFENILRTNDNLDYYGISRVSV